MNINEYQEEIVTKLNDIEEIKGYSFLPTGLGNYENRKELMNQIIRQSTLEEKKYIYTYIELKEDEDITKVEQEIETLTKELKDTLLIITGEGVEEIPFILWSKKEESKEWIIRPPKEKEYSQFTHMGSKLEKLYKRERRDTLPSCRRRSRDRRRSRRGTVSQQRNFQLPLQSHFFRSGRPLRHHHQSRLRRYPRPVRRQSDFETRGQGAFALLSPQRKGSPRPLSKRARKILKLSTQLKYSKYY